MVGDDDPETTVRAGIAAVLRSWAGPVGTPRVRADLPNRVAELKGALLGIASVELLEPSSAFARYVAESCTQCVHLLYTLEERCDRIRQDAASLPVALRESPADVGPMWDELIERHLKEGKLPFASSDICPVTSSGGMEVRRWGQPAPIVAFAERHIANYEFLDDVGRVAIDWSRQTAIGARRILRGL